MTIIAAVSVLTTDHCLAQSDADVKHINRPCKAVSVNHQSLDVRLLFVRSYNVQILMQSHLLSHLCCEHDTALKLDVTSQIVVAELL